MGRYTPEQRRNINTALRLTRRDRPKTRRALLEAMAVESNYRHLRYGDRDSVGVLQQRPSQGWGPASENAQTDMLQFLQRARRAMSGGYKGTAGQLAQSVQRSAFPDRYDQRRSEVNALMRGTPGGRGFGGGLDGAVNAAAQSGGINRQAVAAWLMQRANSRLSGQEAPGFGALLPLLASQQNEPHQVKGQVGPYAVEVQGPMSKNVRGILNEAQQYLGTPYKWGGSKPGGFDCSGLLYYVYGKHGVSIPRTSQQQWKSGRPVKGKLRPGDGVFFEPTKAGPGHVGMYIGNGRFIESPHTGANVRISRLAGRSDYMGARRYA